MYLVDANILVYSTDEDSEHHAVARDWLDKRFPAAWPYPRWRHGDDPHPVGPEKRQSYEEGSAHGRGRAHHGGRSHLHAAGPWGLGGSAMSGVTFWAVAGPVIALAGLAMVAIGLRRRLAS